MEFFWRLVGGDPFILRRSGEQSKYWFFVLGILFFVLTIITFSAFLGLFYGVIGSFMTALIGTIIFTFILKNLYRLVLISLEPNTLPVSQDAKNKPWAYFVRITIVFLIGAFVSKCIETMLFGHWVDDIIEGDLQKFFGGVAVTKFQESKYFILHMKELNLNYPWINIVTLLTVALYIVPIMIKHRLKKRNEYYQIRKVIDKRLVEERFSEFKSLYIRNMQNIYVQKFELDKRLLKEDFDSQNAMYVYKYHQRYIDEPFNTQPILKYYSYKTTQEFLDNF